MSNRLCGYCRVEGHQMPKCELKAQHRQTVLTHTPKQRKELLHFMATKGFGYGAVLRLGGIYMYGKEATMMLHDTAWVQALNYVSQKKKKYSKQSIVNPQYAIARTLDGRAHPNQYGSIAVTGLITGEGSSNNDSATISMADIANPKLDGIVDNTRGYSCALIEPSYVPYDVPNEHLTGNIRLHERLMMPEDKDSRRYRWEEDIIVTGIAP